MAMVAWVLAMSVGMAFNMGVPMAAWMRYRGILSKNSLILWQHALMMQESP